MSLNGLDASAVAEAHQAALADPGGWFLLKYTNRDTVELLSRGTGGVGEAKGIVEQYEEKSPLYGLMQFRRKRVMLKYVPVGTSRLLQVRLTVQFQSVLDAFPHDTVFSFNAPSEFSESALGLSAMLQPSTHGTSLASSAASIKHRRLDEISEDAEDAAPILNWDVATPPSYVPPTPPPARTVSTPTQQMNDSYDSLPASALKAKALLARRKEVEIGSNPEQVSMHTRGTDSLTLTMKSSLLPSIDKSLPATPEPEPTPPLSRHGVIHLSDDLPPPIPPKLERPRKPMLEEPSVIVADEMSRPGSRMSTDRYGSTMYKSSHLTSNESDSINKWNDQVAVYTPPLPKPKQKRAPRPHVEATVRPKTSNTASIPNTVRASSRQGFYPPDSMLRPSSQQSSKSVPNRFASYSPLPPMPANPYLPPVIRPDDVHKPSSIASSNMTESTLATPEKLRLMKALQNRKRHMILTQRAATSMSTRPSTAFNDRIDEADESTMAAESFRAARAPFAPPLLQKEVVSAAADVRRDHDSSTASPTSATNTSAAQSTKPSSISGEAERKESPRNSSVHTDSSATPKAADYANEPSAQSPVEPVTTKDESILAEDQDSDIRAVWSPVEATPPQLPQITASKISTPIIEEPNLASADVQSELPTTTDLSQSPNPHLNLPPRASSRTAYRMSKNMSKNMKHLTITSVTGRSSTNMSIYSDDSIMDEIQYATLHEAKPIQVPRTPATPKMRKLSSDRIRDIMRVPEDEAEYETVTTQAAPTDKSTTASIRSVSNSQQHFTSDEPMPPLSTKSSLGSGISKRIKALEVLTHRDHRDNSSAQPSSDRETNASKSGLSNLLNRASMAAQLHPSKQKAEKANERATARAPPIPTRSENRNPAVHSSLPPLNEMHTDFKPSRKGETVSVTARIVRDTSSRPATSASFRTRESALNMHRSPLIMEHERNVSDPASVSAASYAMSRQSADTQSTTATEKSRVSLSSHRSGSTIRQYLTEGRTSRMSFMSGKKSSRAPSESSSIGDDKRSTRTSRLLKRVSGISGRFGHKSGKSGSSRDQTIQPETIPEQAEDERRQSIADSMLQMVDIGDVNVQFPETLLWKRRFMRIDDQGNLIFSTPTDNPQVKTITRKFHLSDLEAPVIPTQEREEMAWSILFDLKSGGSIQCACESKDAQEHILKMLLDAHYAYNSLYT